MFNNYWQDRETWPFVPLGYYFLPDAFNAIGRKVMPDEWTGEEVLVAYTHGNSAPALSRDRLETIDRRGAVMGIMHQLAERRSLAFFTRQASGEMKPVDSRWWNCSQDVARDRLEACALNSNPKYLRARPGPDVEPGIYRAGFNIPIFVEEQNFIQVLNGIQVDPIESPGRSTTDIVTDHLLAKAAAVAGIQGRAHEPCNVVDDPGTGLPGAPEKRITPMLAEFDRRVEAGTMLSGLAAEARALHAWYRSFYPDRQCATVKSIQNRLREPHRQAKQKNDGIV